MRRLIESLTPQARQLYWKWVGGIFILYVVLSADRSERICQSRITAKAGAANRS